MRGMNMNVCMFEDTASLCTPPIVCSKNWYVGSQDFAVFGYLFTIEPQYADAKMSLR